MIQINISGARNKITGMFSLNIKFNQGHHELYVLSWTYSFNEYSLYYLFLSPPSPKVLPLEFHYRLQLTIVSTSALLLSAIRLSSSPCLPSFFIVCSNNDTISQMQQFVSSFQHHRRDSIVRGRGLASSFSWVG